MALLLSLISLLPVGADLPYIKSGACRATVAGCRVLHRGFLKLVAYLFFDALDDNLDAVSELRIIDLRSMTATYTFRPECRANEGSPSVKATLKI